MLPAVGGVVIVGVARAIVIGMDVVAVVKLALSVGVKVMLTVLVPAFGVAEGVVKANVPGTEAVPPVRLAPERDDPYVMVPAVGGVVMVGVAPKTVTGMVVEAVV
jgi:hypothetical protein